MSLSRELLMRYHDGEVSPDEARYVEDALEQEPALGEELEAYGELGSFVRAWGEASSDAEFDISDSVLDAIEQEAPRAMPVRTARVRTLLPRVATWVAVGAAIAAGSVLVVRSWSAPRPMPPGPVSADSSALVEPSVIPADSAALLEDPMTPATIESVDFGSNTGTVFVVSTDDSETPVVWMPDDGEPDADETDRSESL